MLVISRKENEKIKIGDDIEIVIVSTDKNQVKIGIEAPKHISILRGELIEEVTEENKKAATTSIKDLELSIKEFQLKGKE